MEPTLSARLAAHAELRADTFAGHTRRTNLQTALKVMDREEHGLGIEMNQRYNSSAVYTKDQGPMPTFATDPLEHYHATTYPGARLPHVWLDHAVPAMPVSTIDLAGKGRFLLLTGIGGEGWKDAAKAVAAELDVPIVAYSIGYGRDYRDLYLDWVKIRDVEDSGCVLVRPDYYVAWRCERWEEGCGEKLKMVLRSVLSLD